MKGERAHLVGVLLGEDLDESVRVVVGLGTARDESARRAGQGGKRGREAEGVKGWNDGGKSSAHVLWHTRSHTSPARSSGRPRKASASSRAGTARERGVSSAVSSALLVETENETHREFATIGKLPTRYSIPSALQSSSVLPTHATSVAREGGGGEGVGSSQSRTASSGSEKGRDAPG